MNVYTGPPFVGGVGGMAVSEGRAQEDRAVSREPRLADRRAVDGVSHEAAGMTGLPGFSHTRIPYGPFMPYLAAGSQSLLAD
jgi:hypothetical protein